MRISVLVFGALVVSACSSSVVNRSGATPTDDRIGHLFSRHCALCHGSTGAGDGPASGLLDPRPRDFGSGRFALVSTENGVPTDADLARTIARGMPGSAMPSFGWLDEADRMALAALVRKFAIRGMARRLGPPGDGRYGRAVADQEALAIANGRLTPGAAIVAPEGLKGASLEVGAALYVENCAACHGLAGQSRELPPEWRESTGLRAPRDFAAGVLKGGASPDALAHRIVAGMPACGMPPTRLDGPESLAALVGYVRTLLPPDADTRLTQRRSDLVAARVNVAPTMPNDASWEAATEVRVTLAPLAWRDDAIFTARVAALHDGRRLSIRLRWRDPTRDDGQWNRASSDGAAVQLSADAAPPLFGMGAVDSRVDIWHWRAFRFRDIAGALDLHDPSARGELTDASIESPVAPTAGGEGLRTEGFEAIDRAHDDALVLGAKALWSDAGWEVVWSRELQPRSEEEIALSPGEATQMSLAIWDASGGDRAGRKSITIWHQLNLAP